MEIEIVILKYDEMFTKRKKDAKRNTWFSFPNDLMTHPDFFNITGDEFKAFLWCVSVCSKFGDSKIRLDIEHACHFLKLKKQAFDSMLEKLIGKQIDVVSGPQTATNGPQSAPTSREIDVVTFFNLPVLARAFFKPFLMAIQSALNDFS